MLSHLQQYAIYILAAVIVAAGIFAGVQTARLAWTQKDLVISQKEVEVQRSRTETMAATMRQMAIIGDSLQHNFDTAQLQAQVIIRTHKEKAEALAAQIVPSSCKEAVDWGVGQAGIIEKGW